MDLAGIMAGLRSFWSMRRRKAFRDVDGPSPWVIDALRARRHRRKPEPDPLRCRTGDLAIVVSCNAMPYALGMLVWVEAPAAVEPFDWLIRTEGSPFPFVTAGPQDGIAHIRDACLRPIRPDPEAKALESVTHAAALLE